MGHWHRGHRKARLGWAQVGCRAGQAWPHPAGVDRRVSLMASLSHTQGPLYAEARFIIQEHTLLQHRGQSYWFRRAGYVLRVPHPGRGR